jgi:hypothetical protein
MKKRAFVPAADCLEGRIALSGIRFIGGLPVLTSHALIETYSAINCAFTRFATKGENYNLLGFNLTKAITRIPYNVRDGLRAEVQQEPGFLQSDIQSGVAHPVKVEYAATISDVRSFVQSEVADGIFIFQ